MEKYQKQIEEQIAKIKLALENSATIIGNAMEELSEDDVKLLCIFYAMKLKELEGK